MLDVAILGVLALSALAAFARGIVRALIGLVAWIAGFVGGLAFAPTLATFVPRFADAPWLPLAIAFALIFVLAIVAGALIAWPLRAVIHGAGLGFVDRGLGAAFGIVRGGVFVLTFVLLGGWTTLPQRDWWQNSLLAPAFETAALSLRPWLPPAWAAKLAYPERTGAAALDKA